MPKVTTGRRKQRHTPLGQQILSQDAPRAQARIKQRSERKNAEEEAEQVTLDY